MNKKTVNNKTFYGIGWSREYPYERISASRILPDLPGIVMFYEDGRGRLSECLCFACWREGLRMGVKMLFDPLLSKQTYLRKMLENKKLVFKYCIVDSSSKDLQDVFAMLIGKYKPELNSADSVTDSGRYDEINLVEKTVSNMLEKVTIPGFYN
ncbi:MAG: hypothetical protein JW982_16375 [Spirochaetes bacterium]|nr:hypothetical protein [Spirochaetota bacterium]